MRKVLFTESQMRQILNKVGLNEWSDVSSGYLDQNSTGSEAPTNVNGTQVSVNVINPEDEIIEFLSKEGLTIQNGRVALWLSEDHRNKDEVELSDSLVEVLIFKEAIALGWDCPRASILFLQRVAWRMVEFNRSYCV